MFLITPWSSWLRLPPRRVDQIQLNVGIMEKDASAMSQLSDKGVSVNRAHRITYVWLLTWADFQKYARSRVPTSTTRSTPIATQRSVVRLPPGTLRRQAHRYRQNAVG